MRRQLLTRLEPLAGGCIEIEDAGGRARLGVGDLAARVEVRDPRFYRRVALGGSLGALSDGQSWLPWLVVGLEVDGLAPREAR